VAGVVTAAVLTAGAVTELPKEHHSAPVTPIVKSAPVKVVNAAPATGGLEAAVAAGPVESTKPAIASNAVAVGPTKAEELQEAVAVTPKEEVTPAPEEIAPPEEAVAVEDPEAGASEVEASGLTGGVEVDSATAASPTTTPGAHTGKGTVTVTVTPETPLAVGTPVVASPTGPPAEPAPTVEAPAPTSEAPVEAPPAETP
jgi:hypothetical protein